MTLNEFEKLSDEIRLMKIDLLELRRKVIAAENDALRIRIKSNANKRRDYKHEADKLRAEVQPQLPF